MRPNLTNGSFSPCAQFLSPLSSNSGIIQAPPMYSNSLKSCSRATIEELLSFLYVPNWKASSLQKQMQNVLVTSSLTVLSKCLSFCSVPLPVCVRGSSLPWAQMSFPPGKKEICISSQRGFCNIAPSCTHKVREPPLKASSSLNTSLSRKHLWISFPEMKYCCQGSHSSQAFQDKHKGLHLFTKEDKSGLDSWRVELRTRKRCHPDHRAAPNPDCWPDVHTASVLDTPV